MKKIKINIDRPSVSPGEVRQHMDFQKVLNNYQAVSKPFYKTGGFMASVVVVGLATIAGAIYFLKPADEKPVTETIPTVSAPKAVVENKLVNPPIKDVDVSYNNYNVAADKESVITHKKTKITVPAEAFIDKNGKRVTKPVDIKYREINDAADIIISGVPLVYDDENKTYSYSNGGTIEIKAFVEGEEVRLEKGKSIEIQIETKDKNEYDLLKLDEKSRKWKSQGSVKGVAERRAYVPSNNPEPVNIDELMGLSSEMQSIESIDEKINLINKQLKELESLVPQPPKKAEDNAYIFDIDILPEEFPELEDIEGLKFQIPSTDKSFTADLYEIVYDSVSLERKGETQSYLMTLWTGGESLVYTVYPVLEGRGYKKAYKAYESEMEIYNSKLESKNTELDLLIANKAAQQQKLEEYRVRLENERRQQEEIQQTEEARVYRTFSISSFGIYTSIRKEEYPTDLVFTPKFVTAGNEVVSFKDDTYYLADITTNALYTYKGAAKVGLVPGSNNLIWGILTDGRLAVVRNNQLQNATTNATTTLIVEIADKEYKTTEDIKAFLGF